MLAERSRRSDDPNFPAGLRIQPSSSIRIKGADAAATDGGGSHASTSGQDAPSWEVDTAQDIELYGIAGRIWEAAYLLARYLVPPAQAEAATRLEFDPPCSLFPTHDSPPLTIVELGSGAGYGSLHLASQLMRNADALPQPPPQTRLVLTDLENVVPLMERNVARAGYEEASDVLDVRVRSLAWGNHTQAAALISELRTADAAEATRLREAPITHILCSDLVYFPELLPPLLRSLVSLSAPTTTGRGSPELVISYKIRSLTKEQPFWSALGSWFDFRAVDCRRAKASWHRFGSEGNDYGASSDCDQELFVFVGRRRPETLDRLAPESDTHLMQGARLRPCSSNPIEYELETPSSGQDYFEWLLLSNMGSVFD